MPDNSANKNNHLDDYLKKIEKSRLTALDFLPRAELSEKLIELVIAGFHNGLNPSITSDLAKLRESLTGVDTQNLKVVVLGGGTGLSNIIGGDSKSPHWISAPFGGLKHIFPSIHAIVCITDDGGSTGELLKDLPLIALGDIRRVLLSSIQLPILKSRYQLDDDRAMEAIKALYLLFNHRFSGRPPSEPALTEECGADLTLLPEAMRVVLQRLISFLFNDERLAAVLARNHCLGNLLLAAAIYLQFDNQSATSPVDTRDSHGEPRREIFHKATVAGLGFMAQLLGADPCAVLPCTTTQARLQMLYSNGILVTGEYRSANAKRNYPVDRVFVEFSNDPLIPAEVLNCIREADIILLAPGSLYSSTIPILQVPGLADKIRANGHAMKLLIANLWVQMGETDVARDNPDRRFYVSDLISAYNRNIPGGVDNLFHHVLALGLQDIPGSVLQSYALEEKVPIYLDRERIQDMGFSCIEAGFFSQSAMAERRIIQHDPDLLAQSVKTLWAMRNHLKRKKKRGAFLLPAAPPPSRKLIRSRTAMLYHQRFAAINKLLQEINTVPIKACAEIRERLSLLFWNHPDIPMKHLMNLQGIMLIAPNKWRRSQKWDNVFSFYDVKDNTIKIRRDMLEDPDRFACAFLIALGQSLLGDYVATKEMVPVTHEDDALGKAYRLTLKPAAERNCYFSDGELDTYLRLVRMTPVQGKAHVYTRLINGTEGFTPPGLLFGLIYVWYLNNTFSSHIEYKMAIMRNEVTNLIPEQVKIHNRRQALIDFFRVTVFRYNSPLYD